MFNKEGYDKQYYLDHQKCYKQWRLDHREERKKYIKEYNQTIAGKASRRRGKFKRRSLGFIPLNKPFIGCVAHHISGNFVIYIPEEIHQSLKHNVWTWRNMEQMNKLAIEFL